MWVLGLMVSAILGVSIVVEPAIVAALIAVIGFAMISVFVSRLIMGGQQDAEVIRRWTIGTYWGHLGLSIAIIGIPGAVDYLGGDANTYHNFARGILSHWTEGTALPTAIGVGKSGYGYALASLYWILGTDRIVGLALNAAASAALIPLMHDTTRRLFGREATKPVRWIVALQPGFLIWTSQLLREAVILFLLAVALNATVRCIERVSPTRLLTIGLAIGALLTDPIEHRSSCIRRAACAASSSPQRNAFAAIGSGLAAAFALVAVVAVLGLGQAGFNATSNASLDDVQRSRASSGRAAESGFLEDADVSDSSKAISFLPIGLTQTTLGPFPWSVSSVRQIPGLLETMTIWLLDPTLRSWTAKSPARQVCDDESWVLIFPALFIASGLALARGELRHHRSSAATGHALPASPHRTRLAPRSTRAGPAVEDRPTTIDPSAPLAVLGLHEGSLLLVVAARRRSHPRHRRAGGRGAQGPRRRRRRRALRTGAAPRCGHARQSP